MVARKELAGPHVRAACARHLRDLKQGKERGLRFDRAAARRAIDFFHDVLHLAGGEHEGKPFILTPWEAFIVGSLFGWKASDGFRRFRVAFVEAGKGSGKTPLAAGIGLLLLTADAEPRAEIYAAATKKDQAMIAFRDAVAMVDQSPALANKLVKSGIGAQTWNLAYLAKGAFFRPIATDDGGQSGPRPHGALIDEIHEHRNNVIVEMMRAGTKGLRQALIFMITNSGFDRTTVCFDYHQYGVKVAAGDLEDDAFFSYICALDEDDDPFLDTACWPKANPSLGVTIKTRYLEEQVTQARGMPAKESIVRRLNFCQWVDAESPWIAGDLWRACREEFDLEEMREFPCFLGLDLSATTDLTALAAVWRAPKRVYARVWFWTPAATLLERARKDSVPYDVWVKAGHIVAVPGRSIDYSYPAQKVAELTAEFNVRALAFDSWGMKYFLPELDRAGVANYLFEGEETPGFGLCMRRHGQSMFGGTNDKALWMPRSIDLLEKSILKGELAVIENPVLDFASASAVLITDAPGNKAWDKRKSTGRIDGIVALSEAIGAAFAGEKSSDSVYEERGVLTV